MAKWMMSWVALIMISKKKIDNSILQGYKLSWSIKTYLCLRYIQRMIILKMKKLRY